MRQKRDLYFYEEQVFEFISECTHSGHLDYEEFENKISGLATAAQVDGIEKDKFNQLVAKALKNNQDQAA